MDSLKQYGESSSICSSSSSLIHFSSCALVLGGGGGRRAFQLAIHFADILHTTGSPGNASRIKARARCGQSPCKRSFSLRVMGNGKWRDVPSKYDEFVPCSQRQIGLMVHRPATWSCRTYRLVSQPSQEHAYTFCRPGMDTKRPSTLRAAALASLRVAKTCRCKGATSTSGSSTVAWEELLFAEPAVEPLSSEPEGA